MKTTMITKAMMAVLFAMTSVLTLNAVEPALSPRSTKRSVIFRNCRSSNTYSVSSRLKPLQRICGTTVILYLFWMAAATDTVPGRRRSLLRWNSPLPRSLYTYSLRCVVILMYLGSNSRNVSIVSYNFSMPVPFSGGNISKEKAVFSLLFIRSITLISSSLSLSNWQNPCTLGTKIRKRNEKCPEGQAILLCNGRKIRYSTSYLPV